MRPNNPKPDDQQLSRLTRKLERERKSREQAESLLEQKSLELYEANQKLQTEIRQTRALSQSVDATRDGVALINAKGHFFHMNPAYAAMFEYSQAALMSASWMSLYREAEQERFAHSILPQLRKDGFWQGEAIGQTHSGVQLVQDITLSALPEGGMIFAIRNITERRSREIYARELETRLQKAEREAELFTLGNAVAHDFNNLIAAISSNAILLKMDLQDDIENYHRANQIEIATQQAAGVIRSLELERSNETQETTEFDLVELIHTGLQIAGAIKPDHITIETDLPKTAMISANQVLLTRCLLNISKNAFYAIKGQGVLQFRVTKDVGKKMTPKAHVHALGEPKHMSGWCLEITDNGTGMSADKLARIFEDFYTTKPKRVGSGLGLQSLKGLTDTGAASVEVETLTGFGTRFRIRFMQSGASVKSAKTNLKIITTKAGRNQTPKLLNIMLVDDNALVGAALKEQIKRMGHTVEWYESPRIALTQFKTAPKAYDLIITDLTMPQLSGHDLSAKIKAANPDARIILYSGQAAYVDNDGLYTSILQKPITMERLEQALAQAVSAV